MARRTERITIHDIAREAGVSVSTVSRVLNDKDDVAPGTQAHVQKIIDEFGYASNLAARSMRSRRANLLGMIMPDVEDPFSIAVLKGVNRAIKLQEYDLLIYTSGDRHKRATGPREQHYVSLFDGGLTDGQLIVAPEASVFQTSSQIVVINPNTANPDYPAVIATNKEGAMAVMDYLIGLGHRRIGFIGGRADLESASRRLVGYRAGLARADIPFDADLVETGDFKSKTAKACARRLLDLPNRPSAIFAANDQSAFGVMELAKERGLSIPEDLSVVGYDNIPESKISDPPLTTVDQAVAEMGFVAANMLIELVSGREPDHMLHKIPAKLIVRCSCQAPAELAE